MFVDCFGEETMSICPNHSPPARHLHPRHSGGPRSRRSETPERNGPTSSKAKSISTLKPYTVFTKTRDKRCPKVDGYGPGTWRRHGAFHQGRIFSSWGSDHKFWSLEVKGEVVRCRSDSYSNPYSRKCTYTHTPMHAPRRDGIHLHVPTHCACNSNSTR